MDRTNDGGKQIWISENGDHLELTCHVDANPWIDGQVKWHLAQSGSNQDSNHSPFMVSPREYAEMLLKTDNARLTNHSQSLHIDRLDHRLHTGSYWCQVESELGVASSEAVQVNIARKFPLN